MYFMLSWMAFWKDSRIKEAVFKSSSVLCFCLSSGQTRRPVHVQNQPQLSISCLSGSCKGIKVEFCQTQKFSCITQIWTFKMKVDICQTTKLLLIHFIEYPISILWNSRTSLTPWIALVGWKTGYFPLVFLLYSITKCNNFGITNEEYFVTCEKASFIIIHRGLILKKKLQYFINDYFGKYVYILIKNNNS